MNSSFTLPGAFGLVSLSHTLLPMKGDFKELTGTWGKRDQSQPVLWMISLSHLFLLLNVVLINAKA